MGAERAEDTQRPLTLEEFEALPEEDGARLELVEGTVVREPRPGARHGRLTTRLASALHTHAENRGLGVVCTDFGVVLAEDPTTVRGPDIGFVAAERLRAEDLPTGFLRVAPDLAVEIVSPSNTASEIQRKVLEYLAAGSRLVWVVDSETRSVSTYRSRAEAYLLGEGDVLDGEDVLPGFRMALEELFAP